MKARVIYFSLLGLLLLVSLACAKSGQILTPEEATAVARGAPIGSSGGVEAGDFEVDERVEFTSREFLIPIMREPGDTMSFSNAARGQRAVVKEARDLEGTVWVRVESPAGNGWVDARFLQKIDDDETAADEGADETPEAAFAVGDEAYLTARAFLVNLYGEPGSNRIAANQQRGEKVTVLEVVPFEGDIWYQIRAPTGTGWVPSESLTAEAP